MRRWSCAALAPFGRVAFQSFLILTLSFFISTVHAQKAENLGTVNPQGFSPYAIAVPPFEVTGSQTPDTVHEVVEHDLFLSGFFQAPTNTEFVRKTHEVDLKENKIHYPDWYRAGIFYVVKGKYEIKGESLDAEFRTFDTTAGTYIFGKRYEGWERSKLRQLAHRISDDISQRITSVPGVSRTQFVFVGETGAGKGGMNKEIFVVDADGQNRKQLTNDRNLDATPAWGANGTEVYYTTYKDYNPDLAGIYADASHSWFISRRAGFNLSPAWSQPKQLIALTLSKDGNSEIYTLNRAGKDLQRLTYNKSIDSSPAWSPKGDMIAFTSDRDGGGPQLYVMDVTGVNVRRLTRQGSYNDGASWSPRGDLIAYSSRIDGIFQIYTVNVNGEDVHQLTSGGHNSEDPTWAPNGWVIGYSSDQSGKKQINTMFIDGRPIAQITSGPQATSPGWGPLSP